MEGLADDCVVGGGVYQGDLTACVDTLCANAIGACCFPTGMCQEYTTVNCIIAGGIYQGGGTDCDIACPGPCGGDVTGDGVVSFPDLTAVLSNWGPCVGCPADVDGDNVVGFLDLLIVLSDWGECQ